MSDYFIFSADAHIREPNELFLEGLPAALKPHAIRAQREGNSLITRTGYTRGGSAMLLMFVPLWNNGCGDLGGNEKKNTCRRKLENAWLQGHGALAARGYPGWELRRGSC